MIHVNFMTALTFCCNPYCDIIISIVLLAQQCIIIISGIAKVASDYLEKETIIEPVDEKEEFWTPLHWAAHYGHTNLFQVLSEHVENINPVRIEPFDDEVTGNPVTPLYLAAERGYLEICRLILMILAKKNPKMPWIQISNPLTPLHPAAENGHFKVFKAVSEYVFDIDPITAIENSFTVENYAKETTPLDLAAKRGHVEICRLIIDRIAINNPESLSILLHRAAKNGHFAVCQLIIAYLEDKNPKDSTDEENTPLHLAAMNGHIEICQLFIENISEKDPENNIGKTPLYYAARRNHKTVCYLIIRIVYENDRTLLQALVRGTHSLTNFLGMQGIIRREEAQTKQQNLLTKPLPTWLGRFGHKQPDGYP